MSEEDHHGHASGVNHQDADAAKTICICGIEGCDGSCRTNCQCSFQERNLAGATKQDEYICPMRCEGNKTYPIPGDCPACGMHLVKVMAFSAPKTEDEDASAYRSMRLKLILSAVFSVPVFILSADISGLAQGSRWRCS